MLTRTAAVALAAAVAVVLSGCGTQTTGGRDAAPSGSLDIVATTTQVADFTRVITGDAEGVSLRQLVQPNQSAHSYEPAAADLGALAAADVLVANGLGLEEWLDDLVDASGFSGTVITAADDLPGVHGEADADAHAAEPVAQDDHGHETGNPHVWTSVGNTRDMVHAIADGLEGASPEHAQEFRANAAGYDAVLADLDDWIRTNIDEVPPEQRLLVTNHDAFASFTADYGITFVGSIIPGWDDNAEPSADALDDLVRAVRATGVRAVFSEASISPKAAETISREAGVAVYSGENSLYADSLGPAGSAGETYLGSQVHNVSLILGSWGATPSALPASVRALA